MARKRYSAEQIIGYLREAEVLLAKGSTIGQVCRKIGITEQTYYRWRRDYGSLSVDQLHYNESFNGKLRDELLNGEVFTTLLEAQVLIENWRKEYNQFRPHSSLGYRPQAPEAIQPVKMEILT